MPAKKVREDPKQRKLSFGTEEAKTATVTETDSTTATEKTSKLKFQEKWTIEFPWLRTHESESGSMSIVMPSMFV